MNKSAYTSSLSWEVLKSMTPDQIIDLYNAYPSLQLQSYSIANLMQLYYPYHIINITTLEEFVKFIRSTGLELNDMLLYAVNNKDFFQLERAISLGANNINIAISASGNSTSKILKYLMDHLYLDSSIHYIINPSVNNGFKQAINNNNFDLVKDYISYCADLSFGVNELIDIDTDINEDDYKMADILIEAMKEKDITMDLSQAYEYMVDMYGDNSNRTKLVKYVNNKIGKEDF